MVGTCFIAQVKNLYDFLDVVTDDIATLDEEEMPEAVRKPLDEAFDLLVKAMNAIPPYQRKANKHG
jgi:hypothetical protein